MLETVTRVLNSLSTRSISVKRAKKAKRATESVNFNRKELLNFSWQTIVEPLKGNLTLTLRINVLGKQSKTRVSRICDETVINKTKHIDMQELVEEMEDTGKMTKVKNRPLSKCNGFWICHSVTVHCIKEVFTLAQNLPKFSQLISSMLRTSWSIRAVIWKQ